MCRGLSRHFQPQMNAHSMHQELAKDVLRQRVLREDDARRSRLQEIERQAGSVAILRRVVCVSGGFLNGSSVSGSRQVTCGFENISLSLNP